MDLESFVRRAPIVYTTRLNEMIILRQDLSKIEIQDIIDAIISESKPQYKDLPLKQMICNTKHEYDNCSQSYQRNNHVLRKVHWETKTKFKLTCEKLKLKVEEIKSKAHNSNTETKLVMESESEPKINFYNQNKIDRLLALCKPLKVVLEDIIKIVSKTNDDTEVINILSDSDDDVIINEQCKTLDNSTLDYAANYVVKNVKDLNNIIGHKSLQNSVLVIYNLYLKELNAYHIGKWCNVTDYTTWKYTEVNKFPMKKSKLIVNIIACCWINRQSYIEFLVCTNRYKDIAKFIETPHSCKTQCTCCCSDLKQFSKAANGVKIHAKIRCNSNIIETALVFQKKTKWQSYPKKINNLSPSSKSNNTSLTFLQMNNREGEVEYYECGYKNFIYSKVINNGINDSSWLIRTLNRSGKQFSFLTTDPIDREKNITIYRQIMKIISGNTECFLRIPLTVPTENSTNINCYYNRDYSKSYTIEHTRSFVELSSKKLKVISITSEIPKNKITNHPIVKSTPSIKSVYPHMESKAPRTTEPKVTIMDQETSQTINCLIKNILHRFRNVFLTINDDGKVSVALNAPLSSLTISELQVLSQILSHAQSQVDKLGLTPGTCLNLETPKSIMSTARESGSISTETANSEKKHIHKTRITQKEKKNDVNKTLRYFSINIGNKKRIYENSFRSYLGDISEGTPKLTNVFSLNNPDCSYSDNLETPLEESNVMNEIDSDSNIPNVSQVKEEITIVDNEIEPLISKKRKHKMSLECNTEPCKIRIKSNGEIVDSDSVETPIAFRNLEIGRCDPISSKPLTSMITSDSNLPEYNRLRNPLIAGSIENEILPYAPEELDKPFFEVHIES